MSGVYIKGMEMPVIELEWTIRRGADGKWYAIDTNAETTDGEWHEIVPVPPHGDLIDRNKLYEKVAEWEAQALHMVEVTMHDEDTTEWRKWSTVLTERSAFKFDVADAPTIIPADPAEEGE